MKRPAGCLRARTWSRNMACDASRVLRHAFSITAIHKGLSRPALQQLLGHDSLTTMAIHLNLSLEDVIRDFQQK
jgi:site-specific recombinase XerD